MPYMGKEKTEGGVYVPDPIREREARATVTAYVAKVGPLLIRILINLEKMELGVKKATGFVLVVTLVLRFQIEGGEVRIINDDEVIATIVDPDDIKSYGV